MLRAILAILVATSSVSCTIIEITDKNDAVTVERSIGFASIKVAPDAGVVTAKISSIGYLSSPLGHIVGFSKQTVTSSDDSCRVIIWLDNSVDTDELFKKLQAIDSVCFSK